MCARRNYVDVCMLVVLNTLLGEGVLTSNLCYCLLLLLYANHLILCMYVVLKDPSIIEQPCHLTYAC